MAVIDVNDTPDWYALAVCGKADPDVFFQARTNPVGRGSRRPDPADEAAKAICATCPMHGDLRPECEDAGHGAPGVWGGYSEGERKSRKGVGHSSMHDWRAPNIPAALVMGR